MTDGYRKIVEWNRRVQAIAKRSKRALEKLIEAESPENLYDKSWRNRIDGTAWAIAERLRGFWAFNEFPASQKLYPVQRLTPEC